MMGRAVRARAIKPLSPTLECPECNCRRGGGQWAGRGAEQDTADSFPRHQHIHYILSTLQPGGASIRIVFCHFVTLHKIISKKTRSNIFLATKKLLQISTE